MRRWMVSSFVLALGLGLSLVQPALAQDKPSSQGTVSLKDPPKQSKDKKPPPPDQSGVVSLKEPRKAKPKPSNTTDQTGVVSLKDEKADEAKRKEKIEQLVEQSEADRAKRKKKIEQLVEQSQQKPKLVPFEQPKPAKDKVEILPPSDEKPKTKDTKKKK